METTDKKNLFDTELLNVLNKATRGTLRHIETYAHAFRIIQEEEYNHNGIYCQLIDIHIVKDKIVYTCELYSDMNLKFKLGEHSYIVDDDDDIYMTYDGVYAQGFKNFYNVKIFNYPTVINIE